MIALRVLLMAAVAHASMHDGRKDGRAHGLLCTHTLIAHQASNTERDGDGK